MSEQHPLSTASIYARIYELQQECPIVGKSAQGYNYKYTPLDQLWDAVRPLFAKQRIGWTCESGYTTVKGDDMTPAFIYGTMKVIVYNVDKPEQRIVNEYAYRMDKPQDVGKCETYYRRYALLKILGIVSGGEDDDAASVQNNALPRPTVNF